MSSEEVVPSDHVFEIANNLFLLYMDQLGTKSEWEHGGVDAATRHFGKLENLVRKMLRKAPPKTLIHGALESDSVVLLFTSLTEALSFVRTLFKASFRQPHMWIRATVLPVHDFHTLRYEEEFGTDFSQVRVFRLSREVLQAISIEKSGFKGMRVLLKRDDYKRKALKVAVSFTHKDYHTDVTPVRRLPDALYPPILRGEYKDFLWMMCDTQAEWELLKYLAHKRLFSAVQHPDEYIHAAVTWSLFSVAGQQLASDLHSKGIPLSAHK